MSDKAAQSGAFEPTEYLVARLHEAIARDGKTSQLDVGVVLVGEEIHLEGLAASAAQRSRITEIASRVAGGRNVRNLMTIEEFEEPEAAEELD